MVIKPSNTRQSLYKIHINNSELISILILVEGDSKLSAMWNLDLINKIQIKYLTDHSMS